MRVIKSVAYSINIKIFMFNDHYVYSQQWCHSLDFELVTLSFELYFILEEDY